MSDFDSLWDSASAIMDQGVDAIVGDRIKYSIAGGGGFEIIPGFVLEEIEGDTVAGFDDRNERKRIKVAKALVPTVSLADRIQHPRLGAGNFRPTNSHPESEGRYWIFDVQKASL